MAGEMAWEMALWLPECVWAVLPVSTLRPGPQSDPCPPADQGLESSSLCTSPQHCSSSLSGSQAEKAPYLPGSRSSEKEEPSAWLDIQWLQEQIPRREGKKWVITLVP